MVISWSDAVEDADNDADAARYHRALAQVVDLDPLVQSFLQAVKYSGKWPTTTTGEYDSTPMPTAIRTRYGHGERHISVYIDGTWVVDAGSSQYTGYLVNVRPGCTPNFRHGSDAATTMAASDFHARMDDMESTKDWIPRELVGYLRSHNIPVPPN